MTGGILFFGSFFSLYGGAHVKDKSWVHIQDIFKYKAVTPDPTKKSCALCPTPSPLYDMQT